MSVVLGLGLGGLLALTIAYGVRGTTAEDSREANETAADR